MVLEMDNIICMASRKKDRYQDPERWGLTMKNDGDSSSVLAAGNSPGSRTWSSSPPRPREDDSWLDEEIDKERDPRMKSVLIEVKQTRSTLSNESKRKYIFEEKQRMIEWPQYNRDMETTEGFEVGEYPYLLRSGLCGGTFVTRYYYPPEITIPDFELDNLTGFANQAIVQYNEEEQKNYSNVLVIKAMRSFANGAWYHLTFQASRDNHPSEIFETLLFDKLPIWTSTPSIKFVRLKIMHDDDYR